MSELNEQLQQIDLALKNAQFNEARILFYSLARHKWPREKLLEICHVARQLNLPYFILGWLHPLVRQKLPLHQPATAAENSMYAIGLTRIGAFAEAKNLLKGLSEFQADKHLALGMLSIWQWNYAQAIRPFKKYLTLLPRADYKYLIGLLNLSACYMICGQAQKGEEGISFLLEECNGEKYPLIHANALEVLAQSQIRLGLYSKAEINLNISAKILKSTGSDYELFVNKWKLILQLMRGEKHDQEITAFKTLAQKMKVFEAAREIDLYTAISQKNENGFLQVYHGTRFSGYKSRIKSLYGFKQRAPRDFTCRFGTGNSKNDVSLNQLELTQSSRKLLTIMLSDHYRPIQLGEAFKELYPDEHFNPETSLPRLYQVFRRLKKEVQHHSIPFQVHWRQKQIFWKPISSFNLHIETPQAKSTLSEMPGPLFSVDDVMENFSISQSSAYRLIDEAVSLKKIKRRGAGIYKKAG